MGPFICLVMSFGEDEKWVWLTWVLVFFTTCCLSTDKAHPHITG